MEIKLDPEQKRIWTEQGLERLRYEYDLNEDSVVYDIGACEGTFLKEIWDRYHCHIVAFEPLKKHYEYLCKKTENFTKIDVFNLAIGGINKEILIEKDSENLRLAKNKNSEKIVIISINRLLEENFNIDLMKINIEGSEYELLKAIKPSKLKLIKNLQVQFHIISENSVQDRLDIHKKLSKTHELTYEYPFCWENWRLK